MGLVVQVFRHAISGDITSGTTSGASVIEIWACTFHSQQPDSATPLSINAALVAAWQPFFVAVQSAIGNQCRTRSIKTNAIDAATGLQITDPTVETEVNYRGANGNTAPTFQSARVSLDNGTRNRRARGGFYLPMFQLGLIAGSRWALEDLQNVVTRVKPVLQSVSTADPQSFVGVYSRMDGAVIESTRVRIGDVPDVIRKRKNAMEESYAFDVL